MGPTSYHCKAASERTRSRPGGRRAGDRRIGDRDPDAARRAPVAVATVPLEPDRPDDGRAGNPPPSPSPRPGSFD
jgi:hypothetical protein